MLDFILKGVFSIMNILERETAQICQVHYIIETVVSDSKNKDLKESFI